jgi:hypothetical protein
VNVSFQGGFLVIGIGPFGTAGLTREPDTGFLGPAGANDGKHFHVLFRKKNAKTERQFLFFLEKERKKT